jgi:uncharacterized cupredoxin-like copper-binding protein
MPDANRRYPILGAAAMVCALGLGAAACSGSSALSIKGSRVDVTVKDFKIDTPASVPSGTVTFVVHGTGPMMHEFNVAWTDLGAKELPTALNGTVADKTDTPHFVHLDEVEGIEMDGTKTLTVTLEPGKRYVMYCNMEGHYEAGMASVVTAA